MLVHEGRAVTALFLMTAPTPRNHDLKNSEHAHPPQVLTEAPHRCSPAQEGAQQMCECLHHQTCPVLWSSHFHREMMTGSQPQGWQAPSLIPGPPPEKLLCSKSGPGKLTFPAPPATFLVFHTHSLLKHPHVTDLDTMTRRQGKTVS